MVRFLLGCDSLKAVIVKNYIYLWLHNNGYYIVDYLCSTELEQVPVSRGRKLKLQADSCNLVTNTRAVCLLLLHRASIPAKCMGEWP